MTRLLVVNPNTSLDAVAGVPVVDAVWAGVVLTDAFARAGARTSKRNRYRPIEARPNTTVPPGLARIYQP